MATVDVTRNVHTAQRLRSIDGLRAVACLMVLLYHTGQFASLPLHAWEVVQNFSIGVSIFIGLSGFCLFYPVVRDPDRFRTRKFYSGRVRRIVPAYYASILFCAVLLPEGLVVLARLAGYEASWQPVPSIPQWLTHLTFTHMFSTATWDGINGSYWSLGLEAEFYALFPLLVLAYRRWGVRSLALPMGVSLLWNLALIAVFGLHAPFAPDRFVWQANALGMWWIFAAGMLAAWSVVRHPASGMPRGRRAATWAGAIGLSLLLWPPAGLEVGGLSFLVVGAGVGLILWAVGDGSGQLGRLLKTRGLAGLGLVSYSFYLVHQPMEWYCSRLGLGLGLNGLSLWAFQLSFGFAVVLGTSLASYRMLEQRWISGTSRCPSPTEEVMPSAERLAQSADGEARVINQLGT